MATEKIHTQPEGKVHSTKSRAEKDAFFEELHLLQPEDDREESPRISTYPVGSLYKYLPIPSEPGPSPEYVYVPHPNDLNLGESEYHRYEMFIMFWNSTWESAHERHRLIKWRVPESLRWVTERPSNVRLVTRTASNGYEAHASLFHLLPFELCRRFKLPLFKSAIWPYALHDPTIQRFIPPDFDARLERAFSRFLWPLLRQVGARGRQTEYTRNDPIKVISQSLDFWLPYVDLALQRRAKQFDRCDKSDDEPCPKKPQGMLPPGVTLERPLRGGTIMQGEDDAREVALEMLEEADRDGRLRTLVDAVKSHRVEDDFSKLWSYEREDFERKLYRKRNKIKVSFVELKDTVPVHGPYSEIHEDFLWQDFLAVCDEKERHVVVCLRNGITKLGDIAKTLGYANHSAVSKRLAKIREKAKRVLG